MKTSFIQKPFSSELSPNPSILNFHFFWGYIRCNLPSQPLCRHIPPPTHSPFYTTLSVIHPSRLTDTTPITLSKHLSRSPIFALGRPCGWCHPLHHHSVTFPCGACDSSWQSFLVLGSDGLPLRIALAATFPNVLWSWCLLGSSFLFQVLQLFQSENFLGFGKLEQKAHPSTELSMDIASLKNTKKSKTPKQPTTKIKSNQHPIPPTTSYCSEKCYPLGAMGFFLHRTSHAELLSPENTLLTSLYWAMSAATAMLSLTAVQWENSRLQICTVILNI